MGLVTSHVFQVMALNCQEIGSCQLISKYKIKVAYLDYPYLPSTYWNVTKKPNISAQESSTPGKSQNPTGITYLQCYAIFVQHISNITFFLTVNQL